MSEYILNLFKTIFDHIIYFNRKYSFWCEFGLNNLDGLDVEAGATDIQEFKNTNIVYKPFLWVHGIPKSKFTTKVINRFVIFLFAILYVR